ncbi:hypothetical protein D3C78_1137850 [compost metagenome]
MSAYRKMNAVLSRDIYMIIIMMEAAFYLGWARLLLARKPFSKIAPSLGHYMEETECDFYARHRRSLVRVRKAIHYTSRYTPWDSKCLVRAIAGMKMLERRGIESTLYLGTAKDESGRLIAHAWLRSGALYITGDQEMDRYTVTGMFAKVIHY